MESIYIPHLTKAPQQTKSIQFEEVIPNLETLTPVRGCIRIQHHGNYLEIVGRAETIMTLTCDRCLKQYNQRLSIDTSEIIWLDEAANQPDDGPLEREIALEDLVEKLSPQGYFFPSSWLYEQMCLAIPQRQICDQSCPGIPTDTSSHAEITDRRWASLESLKRQLP